MSITIFDLRKLLLEEAGSTWPTDVIAQQTGVDEGVIIAFLRDNAGLNDDQHTRLTRWADRHSGISGIGTPTFNRYQGARSMGVCMAVSANELPRGEKYEPGSINATIRTIGMDPKKVAALIDYGAGSIMGNDQRVRGADIADGLVKAAS